MKLSDVGKRLQAPFPAHLVLWRPQAFTKDRSRALMLAHIDARAVQDRLDAICPDQWTFELEVIPGVGRPTVKGRLTVLGITREDIGEAPEGDLGTLKAASSDALKRCAVHFGIGRYLYDLPKVWSDWNDSRREPVYPPELPEWARPDHERTPGGAHLVQAMEQLRMELPEDVDLQREVYKHLKAALGSVHPTPAAAVAEIPQTPVSTVGGISKTTKSQIAAHLEGSRWGLDRPTRLAFTSWLAERRDAVLLSTADLNEAEGIKVLKELQSCRKPKTLLDQWRADPTGLPGQAEAEGAVG